MADVKTPVDCTEGVVVCDAEAPERLESVEPWPANGRALLFADVVVVFSVVVAFLYEVECMPTEGGTCIDGVSEADVLARLLVEVEIGDVIKLVVVTARAVDDELDVVAPGSVSSGMGTIELGLGMGTIELGSSLASLYFNQQ